MVVRQKVFAANSVLKADDVNTYLRDITTVTTFNELSSLDAGIYLALVTDLGSVFQRVSGVWRKQFGPPVVIYENGNVGSSGLVGPNASANIMNLGTTAPYASDCAQLHFMAAIGAGAGSAVGNMNVQYGGMNYAQIYNVTTYAVPQVVTARVLLSAGNNQLFMNLNNGNGQAVGMSYSAVRITV